MLASARIHSAHRAALGSALLTSSLLLSLPVHAEAEAPRRIQAEVGPDVGVIGRVNAGDVSYTPGFAYGGHVRVWVLPWLGVRALARHVAHDIELGSLAASMGNPTLPLSVRSNELLGAIEPTLPLSPRLSLYGGPSASWQYFSTKPPMGGTLRLIERRGSFIAFGVNLGVSFDAIPEWLRLEANFNPSLPVGQRGEFFHETQAFDPNGGRQLAAGFPKFQASYSMALSATLLL